MLQLPQAASLAAFLLNNSMLLPLPLPLPLPLLPACRLDACAVAGVLMGNITTWDDPALVALNPDVCSGLWLCWL